MTTVNPPAITPTPDRGRIPATNERPASTATKGLLAGVALFVACAAACSLPLLLAGGAAITVGAFSGTGALIATLLGVTALIGALWWLSRRRALNAADTGGCRGNCSC